MGLLLAAYSKRADRELYCRCGRRPSQGQYRRHIRGWLEQLSSLAEAVTSWTGNDTRLLELSAEELREGLAAGEPVLVSIRDEGVPLCGSRSYLHLFGRSEYKAGARGA